MKNYIRSRISKLYKNEISKESFINKYEEKEKKSINETYIKELIKRARKNKDAGDIEEVVVLIYSGDFNNDQYIEELCGVILESWHFKHEDIVQILHKLKDPSTVDFLYKVSEMHFDYLDYDDTYQLARKCIKALATIRSANAIKKLQILLKSDNPIISEYAKKELDKLDSV
ncbi:hypothetical protein N6B72_07620 [Chryseobacterium soli]|uniref:hypothetical protein n=1 Tax=Chryseobacterium soli TaxID=445961 RepID=UPI002955117B|nr:hypothetical protein [Chryseobacterium soli]MDV7696783.1 hypothetical protein [Chryseobacterium soli]